MIEIRKADERGITETEWLKSWHSFSFGAYYDPENTQFGCLRVINDDLIAAETGFGEHGHRDMEIVTYVFEGRLTHRDSLGNIGYINAGEVQRMSAGTGIRHSEFNDTKSPVKLLQVWFLPEQKGIKPDYEQKQFSNDGKINQLQLLISKQPVNGSLKINQDVDIYASILEQGSRLEFIPKPAKKIWVQVISGILDINANKFREGDGAKIEGETMLNIKADEQAQFVIFEMV
ncbi:MAG TPA: quercetin 2,3-dioxygenase [Alphaproteobacteria bacterium]|nr:quercetin 2,3-dioxygenase [Alphaproteobacteria bacterium]